MGKFKFNSIAVFLKNGMLCPIIFICILVLSGCVTDNKNLKTVGQLTINGTIISTNPSLFDHNPYEYDPFHEYRLVPGDVLDVLYQIQTWIERSGFVIEIDHTITVKFSKNPELNETQRVRPDGNISLPHIGEVRVVGKTVNEITKELTRRYRRIFKHPDIYIIVPEFNMRILELKKDLHTAPRGLSRLAAVGPDGCITFPLLGSVYVAGKSIPEVDKLLDNMYDNFFPGLTIDLFLERHAPLKVYVLGEVLRPGEYEIIQPTSILDILARAGSTSYSAKLENVVVMRKHENKIAATMVDVKKILTVHGFYPDFSEDEFKAPLTVEGLCKAIDTSGYNLSLKAGGNTIDRLNEILTIPGFYDTVCAKGKKDRLSYSKDVQFLVDKTRDYRANPYFSSLNVGQQNDIKTLNRLVLEETYRQETPKSLDNGNKLLYLSPEDLVYVPKRRLTKMAEVMREVMDISMFQGWSSYVGLSYGYQLHNAPTKSGGTTIVPVQQ